MKKVNKDIFDHYVVKTKKLETPLYFCGTLEGFGKQCVVSPMIFGAYFFDDEDEANELIDDLGPGDWVVSNVSKPIFGGF